MKTFLKANWQELVMVNYTIPPSLLQPHLPHGLELDFFQGETYASLVGFRFLNSRLYQCPIPFFGSFNEVNLRFYVKRKEGNEYRRGVVFLSEIVPHRVVAFLANQLYKEHYIAAPMRHEHKIDGEQKSLAYCWTQQGKEYSIRTVVENRPVPIAPDSLEEFIYEHYYGYTNVRDGETWEYKVNHPVWETNPVISCKVDCDFGKVYGPAFGWLNDQQPAAVFNALGSAVTIDRRINKIIR